MGFPYHSGSLVGVDARIDPRADASIRPYRTDEGRPCRHIPFTGCYGKFGPHPPSGGASGTFPRGG